MIQARTGNRQLMRELNTNLILNLVRESSGVSQVDITQKTRLSSGTVTHIIRELKSRNFVREAGQRESPAGRKPTLLEFNADAGYVIGASFFADETYLAVLDLAGNIKHRHHFSTEAEKGPRYVFKNFSEHVRRLIAQAELHLNHILGIGVGFEGIVDPDKGQLILCSRFGWRNVPIKDFIEQELGIRTYVESDGGTMVLGEYHYGIGKGARDLVAVDVDAGIGAMAVLAGKIRRGTNHMFGEIGHTLMVPDGPVCGCGKKGCLEAVASGTAILNQVRAALREKHKSSVTEAVHSSSTPEALRAVFDAAERGDRLAQDVVRRAGTYLGLAVAGVINLLDPELIVLTGSVIWESKGLMLNHIKDRVKDHVIDSQYRLTRIEQGSLGIQAALIGAATLVYEDIFKIPLA
jgi:N-acetylglucosamine repressor